MLLQHSKMMVQLFLGEIQHMEVHELQHEQDLQKYTQMNLLLLLLRMMEQDHVGENQTGEEHVQLVKFLILYKYKLQM